MCALRCEYWPSVTTRMVTGVPAATLRAIVAPQPRVSSSGCGAMTRALRVVVVSVMSRAVQRSTTRTSRRSRSINEVAGAGRGFGTGRTVRTSPERAATVARVVAIAGAATRAQTAGVHLG